MATAATGTVEAMKRLFESSGNSESGSFINNHDSLHNGMSRGSSRHTNSSKNATNQSSYASSVLSYGTASERSYTDQALGEQSKNKHTPPKVKPKPHVIRKTAPTNHPESSEKYKNSNDHEKIESGSVTGSSVFWTEAANGTKEKNGSSSRLPISSTELGPKHPALTENDFGDKVNKERNDSAAPLSVASSSRNSFKKPPPVPKKPKSVLSGYGNDVVRTHCKYDEALEKQFGLKVDKSAYDDTERWVQDQADRQQEIALNKSKKGANEAGGKTTLNGSPLHHSRSPSVCSSTGTSGSIFTNSSIRSILKKSRPSLGIESKKRLTFKDDNELITRYNYPPEDCYDDLSSLERHRSALDSDSDSSSTFDEPEEYDFVDVSRMNENRIVTAGSTASTTSSSTLKDSAVHQQKYSSHSSRNHKSSKNNDDVGVSKRTIERNSSNKRSDAFNSTPVLVKPSKSGSKLCITICKTDKL
ncbi:unnamed protein product [Taenia asiatica]|uniref:Protein kinase domain-containing protein n=1 Tax=Taenia asiatica TaxID=60517 RepID=A0A0R3W6Y2_TAEAS|nr:unnamed protein product [Taenia asiatica]